MLNIFKVSLVVLSITLIFGGYASLIFSTISGIGYALYSWAHDVSPALALWDGFLLFIMMSVGGLVSLLVGWFITAVVAD